MPAPHIQTLIADDWRDYALLDSGDGRKLERVGPYRFVRPEPQALWRPRLNESEWDKADAIFAGAGEDEEAGRWRFVRPLPETWKISWDGLSFLSRPTPFRHLAFFPEHSTHWRYAEAALAGAKGGEAPEVLNLFGYTGLASLACARAGARVTHVDASKKAIGFARENQAAAGLESAPIRWIADDAHTFVRRELRRGRHYDGIILDPPKFGRGPNGETWRLEESLASLLEDCAALLRPGAGPRFFILTIYAVRLSVIALAQTAQAALTLPGAWEIGEMTLPHAGLHGASGPQDSDSRLLPTAIFARWRG
ncbi:MAG: class I SAM-dependent methyltransferase [Hyphomonadaceae bacterium]